MNILTAKELSEILKVSDKTIYQWSELGQIPCIKMNGSLRFNLDDIKSWISECTKQPYSSYNPLTQIRGPKKGGNE